MKKFKFPFLRMLCIGTCLAAVSLASASAKQITKSLDDVKMICNPDKKEVTIKTSREYNDSVEETVQILLHSYVQISNTESCRYNLKVRKRLRGGEVIFKKDFIDKYGFCPDKVVFNDVTYTFSKGTLTISSPAEKAYISPGCVECLGISKNIGWFKDRLIREREPRRGTLFGNGFNKLVIEGMGFKEIPKYCFFDLNMNHVDITKSGINCFREGALYNCTFLKRIDVNPALVDSFSLHHIDINGHYIVPTIFNGTSPLCDIRKIEYRGKRYEGKFLKPEGEPGAIGGNIREVLQREIYKLNKPKEDEIDEKIAAKEAKKQAKKQAREETLAGIKDKAKDYCPVQ